MSPHLQLLTVLNGLTVSFLNLKQPVLQCKVLGRIALLQLRFKSLWGELHVRQAERASQKHRPTPMLRERGRAMSRKHESDACCSWAACYVSGMAACIALRLHQMFFDDGYHDDHTWTFRSSSSTREAALVVSSSSSSAWTCSMVHHCIRQPGS
jgi:hypothetical protein